MSRNPNRANAAVLARAAQHEDALFGLSQDFPRLIEVDLDRLRHNPDQPRLTFEEETIAELAASIERHGQLQPILVREIFDGPDKGHYLVAAGERRWRALERLGRKTAFAFIVDGDVDEIALVENIQRVDLNAVELARALARLGEKHGYTHEAMGALIGWHQSEVSRLLSILRLPADLLEEASRQGLPRYILSEIAAAPSEMQPQLWQAVQAGGASVRALRSARRKGEGSPRKVREPARPIRHLISAARGVLTVFGLQEGDAGVDPAVLQAEREGLDAEQRRDLQRLRDFLARLLDESGQDQ